MLSLTPQKKWRKAWLLSFMALALLIVLYVYLGDDKQQVNENTIKQIQQGMTLDEVIGILGQPINKRMLPEGMMCWCSPLNPGSTMVFWCFPGSMVYCAVTPNDKDGYGWNKWASTTHYASIQFRDDRVVEVWSSTSSIDQFFSGSVGDRLKRWWEHQSTRFR